jgi:hypothetical protein
VLAARFQRYNCRSFRVQPEVHHYSNNYRDLVLQSTPIAMRLALVKRCSMLAVCFDRCQFRTYMNTGLWLHTAKAEAHWTVQCFCPP